MADTAAIKDELAHLKPRKKCDRLAELSALVRLTGSIHLKKGGFDLTMASANPAVARKTLLLIKDLFATDTELASETASPGRRKQNYVITMPAQPRLAFALKQSGILDADGTLTQGIMFSRFKDTGCRAAYLRGAFLAAGSLASGRHGYHLEIATANAILAEDILTLLEECGFPAKLNERRKDFAVYLSDAESILDFLALAGAHMSRLALENTRIFRNLRGEVNRVVNAEAANLRKAVAAAVGQVADIRRIDETIGLAALPEALKELAALRLKHPDASTSELGGMLAPPVSKIAVYHRFRRIRALAESRRN